MAAYLYKWLFISGLLSVVSFRNAPVDDAIHPFHVATTEINHNAADKTLEISCRIFMDDFEDALARESGLVTDFSKEALKGRMDELVKKYLQNHLSLKVNGKPVTTGYVGWEKENEAVYVYLQVDGISSVTQVDLVDTIMFNLFTDQINIVHIKVNGNRKSHKLTYPEKELTVKF